MFTDNPDPLSRFARHMCCNLRIGLRAALLLRVDWSRVSASWSQIAALMVMTLVPSLLVQLAYVGLDGEFYGYGLPGALYTFSTLLLLAVIAAALLRIRSRIAASSVSHCWRSCESARTVATIAAPCVGGLL